MEREELGGRQHLMLQADTPPPHPPHPRPPRRGVPPTPSAAPGQGALLRPPAAPGAVAAFKVCFWSVLWFAGEKACLQTAASELPRQGEEARLCQRRTKPPEFLQTFLGVLGRRKKNNIYRGLFIACFTSGQAQSKPFSPPSPG